MTQDIWQRAVAFHGHECPGLAIGVAAIEAAKEILGDIFGAEHDETVVCISENDACGVDAIQCLGGCTLGKGNLILIPRGKMAFSFFHRESGRSLRLVLKSDALAAYDTRQEKQTALLMEDWRHFFTITPPRHELPKKAEIYPSKRCERCLEATATPWLSLHRGQWICRDCEHEDRD
ncbi:MAG TPA: formylmethanofuran dehydrogenase [Tissierellia bacterium]|nr:formylmethanofuran dehydrogenase [Tissierellia bacterium]